MKLLQEGLYELYPHRMEIGYAVTSPTAYDIAPFTLKTFLKGSVVIPAILTDRHMVMSHIRSRLYVDGTNPWDGFNWDKSTWTLMKL